jgi:ribosome modulation factor
MIPLTAWVRYQGARRKGLEAGYHGEQRECPYCDLHFVREWHLGYAEGAANRREDLANDTHPDCFYDYQPKRKRA